MTQTECPGCRTGAAPGATLCDACAAHDFMADDMVADLLRAEVAFVAAMDRAMITDGRKDLPVAIYVRASDTFAYACADAELLTLDQVPPLYALFRKDPGYGHVAWLVHRRKERPLMQIEEKLKARGLWDAEMEALPPRERRG